MHARRVRSIGTALAAWMTLAALPGATTVDDRLTPDATTVRELLEGPDGRRETWTAAPSLVLVRSVMDYTGSDLAAGYVATDERLTDAEVAELTADLSAAIDDLTAGAFKGFQATFVEAANPGESVKVLRAGQIVVGRFRGVKARTGNLGYGGRLTRRDGAIIGAVVVLDAAFDRDATERRLLRTHELGHALGYRHVESRPSVMNPRVGSPITDVDRAVMRVAYAAAVDRH